MNPEAYDSKKHAARIREKPGMLWHWRHRPYETGGDGGGVKETEHE